MMKSFEEFQSFGKDGFEAYVASSNALTKGFQAIAQEAADYSRKSFEKGTAAFEKLSASKSFDKALEVQHALVRQPLGGAGQRLDLLGIAMHFVDAFDVVARAGRDGRRGT